MRDDKVIKKIFHLITFIFNQNYVNDQQKHLKILLIKNFIKPNEIHQLHSD